MHTWLAYRCADVGREHGARVRSLAERFHRLRPHHSVGAVQHHTLTPGRYPSPRRAERRRTGHRRGERGGWCEAGVSAEVVDGEDAVVRVEDVPHAAADEETAVLIGGRCLLQQQLRHSRDGVGSPDPEAWTVSGRGGVGGVHKPPCTQPPDGHERTRHDSASLAHLTPSPAPPYPGPSMLTDACDRDRNHPGVCELAAHELGEVWAELRGDRSRARLPVGADHVVCVDGVEHREA
jgi:hypothetical protein